jgi:hypothetical protein
MAAHTPTHGHSNKRFSRKRFALGDPSMAVLTLDLSENDMATMRIEDMIGLVVDLLPGYCFFLFCKLPDLLLLRTLGNRFFVALQTDGDVRHSGESLSLIVLVTGVTFQPLFGMLLVIEGDRLVGFRAYGIVDKEEKQKDPNCQSEKKEFHALDLPARAKKISSVQISLMNVLAFYSKKFRK